jgi:hypothetical protein
MEDCGGKGYREEEEERGGGQDMHDGNERQTPDDTEWWMGKEIPPTDENQHPRKEDMGRCHPDRRINVQIVLGNGNLGLTSPTRIRGERRGRAVWRLAKREADGERGGMGRGKGGPEEITSGGNKGGQRGKHGRGREEDREEPGTAASEQTGLPDKMTCG